MMAEQQGIQPHGDETIHSSDPALSVPRRLAFAGG
jgi:hypothetical protein